jgi:6-phosphogluconolactonase
VSLSAPAICSAKRVTYLALGEGKKQIVATILNNAVSAKNLPASKIKSTQGVTEWYLDEQSAGDLSTNT